MTTGLVPVDEPAGLTRDWLRAALLAAGFEAELTQLDVAPVGTGQMSTTLRARFQVAAPVEGLPASLIVKIPAPDPRLRRRAAIGYRREIDFYLEVAPTVAIRAPRCYLAVASPDAASFTLVLEDLAGATQGDQLAGAKADLIEGAARGLAGLHGPRWCDPSLREVRWGRPQDPAADKLMAAAVAGALPRLAERFGPALSRADLATLEAAAEALPAFLGARTPRFAPVHGDYRLDNLLFEPGREVCAVDWQALTVGSPARDLAYLLATCLSVADRREAEADLIGAYCAELARYGVTDYRPAECLDDYRLALLQCPMIIVLGAAYGVPTARGDAMFAVMIERSCQAIRDLGTLEAMRGPGR